MWYVKDIKYPVAICIAWADSDLGKALKSKNNIGNVWNNDRWDTKEYATIYDGINAIYRTLNNKYQKYSEKIWELSQGWRTMLWLKWCAEKWEYCYATSDSTRGINIINCLNMIYDSEKNEYFEFRL